MIQTKKLAALTLSGILAFTPMLALAEGGSAEADANVQVHSSTTVRSSFLDGIKMRFFGRNNKVEDRRGEDASSTASSSTPMRGAKEEKRQEKEQVRLEKRSERGQHIVDVRVDMLQKLEDHVSGSMRLTDAEKAALTAQLNAQIQALIELKARIASSTSTSTLIADLKAMRPDLRGSLLAMPRTAIIAAADRILNIVDLMTQFGAKLDARITAAKNDGVDVSAAQSAYADYQSKLADAKVQAKAASDLATSLNASSTATSTIQANVAILKDARAKLEAARTDLRMARQDIAKIFQVVKGHGSVTASTTASTTP